MLLAPCPACAQDSVPATQLVVDDEEEEEVVGVAPPPTAGRKTVVARKSVDGIASRVTLAVSCLGCICLGCRDMHGSPCPAASS